MQRPAYYIAIEGVIGVGKTSLARILAQRLNARLILEKFEDNPFLSDFYNDRDRYAFQTQIFFLLSRYRQQMELFQTELFHKNLVTDYMFIKDKLFAYLNLNEKELMLYDQMLNLLIRQIPKPDLVIYLQADTERLMKNIAKRGRDFEKNIDEEYIEALNQMYNQFFFRYNETPLLIINTTDIDFVHNEDDLAEILKTIQKPPAGTKLYRPVRKPS
ncbi:MAG: deoxynucleoside kinase [Candidatus Neomarinimicrobiota bacterium]|nr:deoxynucleoside kinase [Candidatus Neomarinimicrobiota bacterium]RKY51057.1 MAG: deoxynucleoside kinase [Candidatus Neomarinimicrobiota bacterium]